MVLVATAGLSAIGATLVWFIGPWLAWLSPDDGADGLTGLADVAFGVAAATVLALLVRQNGSGR